MICLRIVIVILTWSHKAYPHLEKRATRRLCRDALNDLVIKANLFRSIVRTPRILPLSLGFAGTNLTLTTYRITS